MSEAKRFNSPNDFFTEIFLTVYAIVTFLTTPLLLQV